MLKKIYLKGVYKMHDGGPISGEKKGFWSWLKERSPWFYKWGGCVCGFPTGLIGGIMLPTQMPFWALVGILFLMVAAVELVVYGLLYLYYRKSASETEERSQDARKLSDELEKWREARKRDQHLQAHESEYYRRMMELIWAMDRFRRDYPEAEPMLQQLAKSMGKVAAQLNNHEIMFADKAKRIDCIESIDLFDDEFEEAIQFAEAAMLTLVAASRTQNWQYAEEKVKDNLSRIETCAQAMEDCNSTILYRLYPEQFMEANCPTEAEVKSQQQVATEATMRMMTEQPIPEKILRTILGPSVQVVVDTSPSMGGPVTRPAAKPTSEETTPEETPSEEPPAKTPGQELDEMMELQERFAYGVRKAVQESRGK